MMDISKLWNSAVEQLSNVQSYATNFFTKSLYIFLIIKILFIIPIAPDFEKYYQYTTMSIPKQLLSFPAVLCRNSPVIFLIASAILFIVLLLSKRSYYLNALGFWISWNVSQLCEPIANGSDYVLNLMLLLAIPLSEKPLIDRWKSFQPILFNYSILLLQVHFALIYLLSGYDKLVTQSWRNGEAIKYISQLDYFINPIVEGPYPTSINILIGWFVIIFELSFPILIWFNKFRMPMILIGVLFHLGIIYFLNLPDFGILMILCYSIFIGSSNDTILEKKSALISSN